MNALLATTFLACVALATASVIGGHGVLAGHGNTVTGLGSRAVLLGPSGTVVRSGVAHVAAPVALGVPAFAGGIIGHGGLINNAGLLAARGGVLGHGVGVPAGHGLEGQWIPDINEHLYDDGSYRPQIYEH